MSDLDKPLGAPGSSKANARGGERPARSASYRAFTIFGFFLILAAFFYSIWQATRDQSQIVSLNDPANSVEQKPVAGEQLPAPTSGPSNTGVATTHVVEPRTAPAPTEKQPSSNQTSTAAEEPNFKPRATSLKKRDPWVPIPELAEQSEFGLLPQRGSSGLRPVDAYSQPPAAIGGARVAIVVGGLGLSQTGTQKAIGQLPSEITLAFSPIGNSLQRWMQAARKGGHEIALQLPMEPLGFPQIDPGKGTLVSAASVGANLANLRWALGRVTNYPVVINYLGSNFLNNDTALRPILQEIEKRGLGWLDDGTAQASISLDVAEAIRLPHASANLVIDASQTASRIDAQLLALELLAKRRGYAVGTASAFPTTVKQIAQWAKQASKRGVQIVPLSNVLRDYK